MLARNAKTSFHIYAVYNYFLGGPSYRIALIFRISINELNLNVTHQDLRPNQT